MKNFLKWLFSLEGCGERLAWALLVVVAASMLLVRAI